MDNLPVGFRATVEVVDVTANFDSFDKGNDKMYCHLVVFRLDDQSEYRGQQCVTTKTPTFMAGDIIDIAIKSFTKGIYTFSLDKVHPKLPTTNIREALLKTTAELASVDNLNPPVYNIANSPGVFALQAAVAHNANRVGMTAGSVLKDAEAFVEFLRNNTF